MMYLFIVHKYNKFSIQNSVSTRKQTEDWSRKEHGPFRKGSIKPNNKTYAKK